MPCETSDRSTSFITNPLTNRCRFLGYDIVKGKDYTQIVKAKNGRKVRSVTGVLQLLVPGDVIREKIRPFQRHGKPIHRSRRSTSPPRLQDPRSGGVLSPPQTHPLQGLSRQPGISHQLDLFQSARGHRSSVETGAGDAGSFIQSCRRLPREIRYRPRPWPRRPSTDRLAGPLLSAGGCVEI